MNTTKLRTYLEGCLTDWQQQHDAMEAECNGLHHMSGKVRDNALHMSYIRGRLDELTLLLRTLDILED